LGSWEQKTKQKRTNFSSRKMNTYIVESVDESNSFKNVANS